MLHKNFKEVNILVPGQFSALIRFASCIINGNSSVNITVAFLLNKVTGRGGGGEYNLNSITFQNALHMECAERNRVLHSFYYGSLIEFKK